MAKHIYACLCGDWVNLGNDPNCKMGIHRTAPATWWEENADIWSPFEREAEHTMYQLNHVHIYYEGKDYRINPMFLQIVED